MLTLPAIAFQIPVPPVVWRADSGFRHAARTSAADVIRYEQDELGNALGITAALILELENYSAASLVWVTLQRHDAARYGKPERVKIDGQAYVIAEDGEGGFLIMFCELPASFETEGQTMSKPADDIKADAEIQAEAAAKHEQERELAASKGEALPGDPATAPAQTMEPEDEKKKGGAGAEADPGITPLMSELSLNIRPDIATGPGGDHIVTTMKNSTVDRDAVDALADMAKANADRAGDTQEPAQTPGERSEGQQFDIDTEAYIGDRLKGFPAELANDPATRLELAFEAHVEKTQNLDGLPFEHWDAGGFFDDTRAAFYAAHAENTPQEPAQTPGERDASPEAIIDRQNAESTKAQEAELVASTGAGVPEADDKSGMSYEERIEARAEESRQRHAAEAEAAPERGQEVSMGRGE